MAGRRRAQPVSSSPRRSPSCQACYCCAAPFRSPCWRCLSQFAGAFRCAGGRAASGGIRHLPAIGRSVGLGRRQHTQRAGKLCFQPCADADDGDAVTLHDTAIITPLPGHAGPLAGGQWQAAEGDAGLRAQLSELVDRFQQLTQVPAALLAAIWLPTLVGEGRLHS